MESVILVTLNPIHQSIINVCFHGRHRNILLLDIPSLLAFISQELEEKKEIMLLLGSLSIIAGFLHYSTRYGREGRVGRRPLYKHWLLHWKSDTCMPYG